MEDPIGAKDIALGSLMFGIAILCLILYINHEGNAETTLTLRDTRIHKVIRRVKMFK